MDVGEKEIAGYSEEREERAVERDGTKREKLRVHLRAGRTNGAGD